MDAPSETGEFPQMGTSNFIELREVDQVKVISFKEKHLFDERTVKEVSDQIAASLPNDGSPINLILDFSDVALISSSLLSKMILLQRRIELTRGKLRLCELSSVIESVFRTSNLDRLFKIDRDRRASIEAFG